MKILRREWWDRLLQRSSAIPVTQFKPKPIVINPTNKQRMERHFMRMSRLMRALEDNPDNAEVRAELEMRKQALAKAGVQMDHKTAEGWESSARGDK